MIKRTNLEFLASIAGYKLMLLTQMMAIRGKCSCYNIEFNSGHSELKVSVLHVSKVIKGATEMMEMKLGASFKKPHVLLILVFPVIS